MNERDLIVDILDLLASHVDSSYLKGQIVGAIADITPPQPLPPPARGSHWSHPEVEGCPPWTEWEPDLDVPWNWSRGNT